jgi:hypothetical protein
MSYGIGSVTMFGTYPLRVQLAHRFTSGQGKVPSG